MNNIWAVLQQGVAAGLVALFLLILQRIFLDKLSPRWQYGVWVVLLLRLVVPAGIGARTTVLDLWPFVEQGRVQAELHLSSAYASPWISSLPSAPWPIPPITAPQSVTDWLFVVYLAGVLAWAIWFGLCAFRLHRRVGTGVPVSGARLEAVRRVAEQYQLPLPRRVVECKWDHGPFLMGVLRPTLVLPMGWTPEEAVILHELLHLRHRDVLAGWVVTLFRCLHWYNPVLWYAFDKMGQDREALCDQRVLERLEGEERRDYGRCLLAMADDKAVRIPGATTMANGARGVKARIEAIARFKRYPQGMALASGCITFALALALVAGAPVQALMDGAYTEVAVNTPQSTSQALATGQLYRATTVAGALDAYGKGLLLRWRFPDTALMCQAMARSPEEMPAVLEARENPIPTGLNLDSMSYQEMMDTAFPAQNWWSTGPQFRGLVADGQGGYLCQVLWYRDVDELVLIEEERPIPQDGENWPVEYLCHTVQVRPDGRHWTVSLLAETQGEVEFAPLSNRQGEFFGPVTWVGELDGVKVSISPAHLLETGEGLVGKYELRTWAQSAWSWSIYDSSPDSPPENPMPGCNFYSLTEGLYWAVESTSDHVRPVKLWATPLWDNSGTLEARPAPQTMSVDPMYQYMALEAGDLRQGVEGGSSASGSLGDDLPYFLGPDAFQVTLAVDGGEEQTITLTKTYTTPDGGSYTLPREEETP